MLRVKRMAERLPGIPLMSTDEDNFIKRYGQDECVRRVHLVPPDGQAMEWALARRQQFPDFGPQARVLVTSRREPYDKPTPSSNPNMQIPNSFSRLIRRIQKTKAGKDFVRRPFKTLRKTSGDLIRRYSDGEVAAVFQSRGQAVRIDDLADA